MSEKFSFRSSIELQHLDVPAPSTPPSQGGELPAPMPAASGMWGDPQASSNDSSAPCTVQSLPPLHINMAHRAGAIGGLLSATDAHSGLRQWLAWSLPADPAQALFWGESPMSEMISSSVASVSSGMGMTSLNASVSTAASASSGGGGAAAASTTGGIGLNPAGGGTPAEGSGSATQLLSTSQSVYYSRSSSLSGGSALTFNERMAALVLALVAAVLGQKNKDDEDKNLLAGLVGMMALAGAGCSSGSSYRSLELSQSSQVMQMTTTENTYAVQASSYDRSGSSVSSSTTQTGGTLNIVA